jgi:hypothetical protein
MHAEAAVPLPMKYFTTREERSGREKVEERDLTIIIALRQLSCPSASTDHCTASKYNTRYIA